jgi:hypothetical protein
LHVRPPVPFFDRFRFRIKQRHIDRIEEATARMLGGYGVLMVMGQRERFINDFGGGSAKWARQKLFHKLPGSRVKRSAWDQDGLTVSNSHTTSKAEHLFKFSVIFVRTEGHSKPREACAHADFV